MEEKVLDDGDEVVSGGDDEEEVGHEERSGLVDCAKDKDCALGGRVCLMDRSVVYLISIIFYYSEPSMLDVFKEERTVDTFSSFIITVYYSILCFLFNYLLPYQIY